MLQKSVSPSFVGVASIPLAIVLLIPLMLVERALIQRLDLRGDQYTGPLCLSIAIFLALFLVRKVLSSLGIQVRSRSVERLQAAGRGREGEVADDLPVRIYRGRGLIGLLAFVFLVGGLACLVLVGCLLFTWFPPPRSGDNVVLFTLALLEAGIILIGAAFLARRWCKPELLCEVSEKGIRAPDGFWGRQTFVPWEELARCEIIHDDERIWYDHFVLWDRAGRRRFQSCKTWLGRLRPSDRTRILRALRSRFPQKEKPGPDLEPVLAQQASAAVWDRDLDG
jgi:hypothetical protein